MYEQLAFLLSGIVAPEAFDEMLRRIAFVVASGNNDAHLKNWSILYPDGVSAALTPLYDQTFSGQWPSLDRELALNLGGAKPFGAIDIRRFRELAIRCFRDPDETASKVARMVEHFASAWTTVTTEFSVPADYRLALRRHWGGVPLLSPHALLIA